MSSINPEYEGEIFCVMIRTKTESTEEEFKETLQQVVDKQNLSETVEIISVSYGWKM